MNSPVVKRSCQFGVATSLFLILTVASASAQSRWDPLPEDKDCTKYDGGADDIPGMRIKIFNDSQQYIYPVLTMGKGATDLWMQMFYKVTLANIDKKAFQYPRDLAYRLYINPKNGIAPKNFVCVTLPLFTKRVETINGGAENQFADWWQGGTIQLFAAYQEGSPPGPPPPTPEALDDRYNGGKGGGYPETPPPGQQLVTGLPASALKPTCHAEPACENVGSDEALPIYSDTADLVPSDPSQLVEYTFGAKQVPSEQGPDLPAYVLDSRNVDFDVSYVNLAFLPAALGVYDNSQVGYVGTTMPIVNFRNALNKFIRDNTFDNRKGWPQLVHKYKSKATVEILKLPSPLEVFPSLTEPNARTDLTALTAPDKWPDKIWRSMQTLRDNWKTVADPATGCKPDADQGPNPSFCQGIVDALDLLKANFDKYLCLFKDSPGSSCENKGRVCSGTPKFTTWDPKADFVMSHFYGWTPFTESKEDKMGCSAGDNRLEKSSKFYRDPKCEDPDKAKCPDLYRPYAKAKREFDQLNYGKLKKLRGKYEFDVNPWVRLIHDDKYLGIDMAYAYSVDDAMGNIQAEGAGMVVDIASNAHLPNKDKATPPIQITAPYANDSTLPKINFKTYSLCGGKPKTLNKLFSTFVLNASNTNKCDIDLMDSKNQKYTFRLGRPPFNTNTKKVNWPIFDEPASWDYQTTAAMIDCTQNTGKSNTTPTGYSSKLWCCTYKTSRNGAFAYAQTDPTNVHGTYDYKVNLDPPQGLNSEGRPTFNINDDPCSEGHPIPQ